MRLYCYRRRSWFFSPFYLFFFDITLHFIYLTINVSFVVLDDDIKHTGS